MRCETRALGIVAIVAPAGRRGHRDDGFDVEPPSRQHGAWTFYFEAPGGFTIEVLC